MEFGHKHLPDKFFLEGDHRKSLRDVITREIVANTLIHREYTSSYQAKFVIVKDKMYIENANRAVQDALITPENLEPNPKNPIIASFFRNIGYADQLGSGVRNLFKYSKFYSGKQPEFIEGDVFRIIVPLNDNYSYEVTTQTTTQTTEQIIISLLKQEPYLSQKQIADKLHLNLNTVKYHIRKQQEKGKLKRIGTARKGRWEVEN